MNSIAIVALTAALLIAPGPGVWAQDPPAVTTSGTPVTLQELVLRDGSRLYGSVERETETEVVFRTRSGTLVTVPRPDVMSLRTVTGSIVQGEFQRADPNTSRLIFGPTGRALDKGQVYLGVYEFMMPFIQVGVTDRFSIGGGTPLLFGVDDWERPFWITPKLQVFKGDRAAFSVGALHAFDTDGEGGGIAYGVGTFGSDIGSVTVGGGGAYSGSGGEGVVMMVGAERRLRRNVRFITENYLWTGGDGVASAGFRFFGERLSADLALAMPIGIDDFFLFPVVNFVYVFERK
jgi:hypothetical protein